MAKRKRKKANGGRIILVQPQAKGDFEMTEGCCRNGDIVKLLTIPKSTTSYEYKNCLRCLHWVCYING